MILKLLNVLLKYWKTIAKTIIFLIVTLLLSFLLFTLFLLTDVEHYDETELKTLQWNTPETDKEWIEVLNKGKIITCYAFKSSSSISEKYIVVLEHNGVKYKTLAKLIEDPRWMGYIGNMYNVFANNTRHPSIHQRHWDTRKYQGYPELVAYHVDRLLNFYKKNPFVGRVISNQELYANWIHLPRFRLKDVWRSICHKFDGSWLNYNIYVALSPYVTGLESHPLGLQVKQLLTRPSDYPLSIMINMLPTEEDDDNNNNNNNNNNNSHNGLSQSSPIYIDFEILRQQREAYYNEVMSVSDVMVFDFLVDEHDRKEDKNWIKTFNPQSRTANDRGIYIFWDNGLSFDHGPLGFRSCLDILCGPKAWKMSTQSNNNKGCSKICRFSNSTFLKLQKLQDEGNFPQLLRESIANDVLSPVFHFGLYEHVLYDRQPAYFVADNFFVGMNYKLEVIVDYMHNCIEKYGFENVILPDFYPG